jgi:RNA polymerase sigma-70 factor (ECF subfamily)
MKKTDTQLILGAQQGDMTAFEELVRRYDRQVLNIAKSFRSSNEDAKDIYQEVFMRVYKGLNDFQFKSEFSTWLFRITANVCISFHARKKEMDSIDRQIGGEEDDGYTLGDSIASDSSTDSLLLNSEIIDNVNSALEKLPPRQKLAFTLKYYEDYKIKEIADMLQCSEGSVKRYLFNASNKMREKLKSFFL